MAAPLFSTQKTCQILTKASSCAPLDEFPIPDESSMTNAGRLYLLAAGSTLYTEQESGMRRINPTEQVIPSAHYLGLCGQKPEHKQRLETNTRGDGDHIMNLTMLYWFGRQQTDVLPLS